MSEPRITLLLPTIADPAAFSRRLADVLAVGGVAATVLKAEADDKASLAVAKVLVPVIQNAGTAAMLGCPADPRLVARVGADGAQYPATFAGLSEAIAALKPTRIVGIGGLRARHDAMEAGERDIDYVLFGEPRADDSVPETTRTEERAAWWSKIFTIPCVAYAADLEAVAAMAKSGADFVAIGPWLFESADPVETLRDAVRRIAANTSS